MQELSRSLTMDPTEDDAVRRDLFEGACRIAEPVGPDVLEELMECVAPGTPAAGSRTSR